jgi:hypothetical protein
MQVFKRSGLLNICSATLWLTAAGAALGQNTNAPVDQLFRDLAGYCDRATELSYRSHVLTSDDADTQVYVEGLLRKIVDPRSSLRQYDGDDNCYPDSLRMIESELVVEREGEVRRFALERYEEDTIEVLTPRSFSADGRYLITQVRASYSGAGGGDYVQLLDLQSGAIVAPNVWCEAISSEYGADYLGMTAEDEFVVSCTEYGSARAQIEAFNPQTFEMRQLSSVPAQLSGYGSVESELTVLQVQRFE